MKKTIQFLTIIFALLLSNSVFASGLAELQISIGKGTDAKVASEIREKIKGAVKSSSKWTLYSALGGKLGKAKNCFTIDCLKLAGKNTGHPAGMRVRFSGEAQIYDWSIEIYDLKKGTLMSSQKGACELCGKSEVLRTFERSITAGLQKAKISKTSTTKTDSLPDKKVVEKEPIKEVVKEVVKQEPIVERKKDTSLPDVDSIGKTPVEKDPVKENTRVVIDVFPTNARILLNEKEVGKGSVTMELPSGNYDFQFRLEGYGGLNETINVSEVSNSDLQFKIHMSKTDPEAVYVQDGGGIVDDLDNRTLWGWIGVGSGGALLITGIVLNRIDGTATCSTGTFQQCPEIYNTGTESMITTTAGATLLTAGAGLLLWDLLAGEKPDRRSALIPAHGGKGVAFMHTF